MNSDRPQPPRFSKEIKENELSLFYVCKRLTNYTVTKTELQSVTRPPIVTGAPLRGSCCNPVNLRGLNVSA
jgi:hypothetical protein